MVRNRIVVFIDDNLLSWMPPILVGSNTEKFTREEEQCAFEQLLLLRSSGSIEIAIWDLALDSFLKAQCERVKNLKNLVLPYFNHRISINTTLYFAGEPLAIIIDRAKNILLKSGEKQDDVAVWIMSYIIRTDVTHVATCDCGFINKSDKVYLKALESDHELYKYVKSRRRCKSYLVQLPTKVLADIRSKL